MKFQLLNPFRNTQQPLTTTHKDKVNDALEAILGDVWDGGHMGIFDWLFLGIPYAVAKLYLKLEKLAQNSPLYKIPQYLIGLIHFPLMLLRTGIGLILTAISYPIVLLVAGISSRIADGYRKMALSAHIVTFKYNEPDSMEMLGDFAEKYPIPLSLTFDKINSKLSIGVDMGEYKVRLLPNPIQLEAMCKINLFKIIEKMENEHFTLLFHKTSGTPSLRATAIETTGENKISYNIAFREEMGKQALTSLSIDEACLTLSK